jgi:hypothetical protein
MVFHSASVTSSVGVRCVRPAQLTMMSIRPMPATTASRSAASDARSVTSDRMRSVLRPIASIAAAAASRFSAPRAEAITSAPASARPSAIARPMPVVPPTTTAMRPSRLNGR